MKKSYITEKVYCSSYKDSIYKLKASIFSCGSQCIITFFHLKKGPPQLSPSEILSCNSSIYNVPRQKEHVKNYKFDCCMKKVFSSSDLELKPYFGLFTCKLDSVTDSVAVRKSERQLSPGCKVMR